MYAHVCRVHTDHVIYGMSACPFNCVDVLKQAFTFVSDEEANFLIRIIVKKKHVD